MNSNTVCKQFGLPLRSSHVFEVTGTVPSVSIVFAVQYLDHERDAHDALRLVLRFRHIVVKFCVETVQLDLQQK